MDISTALLTVPTDTDEPEAEELLDPLGRSAEMVDEEQLERFGLAFSPQLALHPRPYQREALRNWLTNGGRGVVVLPTGAGKTIVAFMALEQLPVRTLVVRDAPAGEHAHGAVVHRRQEGDDGVDREVDGVDGLARFEQQMLELHRDR